MNKDEAGDNWKQFKGKVKEQWGKLTDDDMTIIEAHGLCAACVEVEACRHPEQCQHDHSVQVKKKPR